MNHRRSFLAIALLSSFAGCASDVIRQPTSLAPAAASAPLRLRLAADAPTRSSSGYERVLPAGSVWELKGSIAQGAVYRRVDDIFTIEGAHVHEAFIVIQSGQLIGFYLPVEQAFSPAEKTSLKIN